MSEGRYPIEEQAAHAAEHLGEHERSEPYTTAEPEVAQDNVRKRWIETNLRPEMPYQEKPYSFVLPTPAAVVTVQKALLGEAMVYVENLTEIANGLRDEPAQGMLSAQARFMAAQQEALRQLGVF